MPFGACHLLLDEQRQLQGRAADRAALPGEDGQVTLMNLGRRPDRGQRYRVPVTPTNMIIPCCAQ